MLKLNTYAYVQFLLESSIPMPILKSWFKVSDIKENAVVIW